MVQRKSSELEQNYGTSYTKNCEVKVVPAVDLTTKSPPVLGSDALLKNKTT